MMRRRRRAGRPVAIDFTGIFGTLVTKGADASNQVALMENLGFSPRRHGIGRYHSFATLWSGGVDHPACIPGVGRLPRFRIL
jgi:hypothetical protein